MPWVLLYSRIQNAYHIEPVEEWRVAPDNDYHIIAQADSYEEVLAQYQLELQSDEAWEEYQEERDGRRGELQ